MQLLFLAAFASANLAVSATGDLEWTTHYAQAKKSAAEHHRPLLVVLEDPNDPESKFDEAQMVNDESNRELAGKFELCRVDVTTEYGKRVAKAFGANELPYTAITDKSAKFITFRKAGKMNAEQWASTMSETKDGATTVTPVENTTIDWSLIPAQPYCPNCVNSQYR